MQINEIKVEKRKKKKTIGRGGKRGSYSGRGGKGQTARSGGNINPLFEGGRSSLVERLKKVRGFKSKNRKKNIVTLDMLEKNFSDGEMVSLETLLNKKIVEKAKVDDGVKILNNGKLSKKLSIEKGILISSEAKAAVEKAGGKIDQEAKK